MAHLNSWFHRHMGIVLGFALIGAASVTAVLSQSAIAVSPAQLTSLSVSPEAGTASEQTCPATSARGALQATTTRRWTSPKYVFFFIGDGMANAQIHAAEAYLARAHQSTGIPGKPYPPDEPKAYQLRLSQLPVCGMQTTYAADRFITDSASAGTAMACGIKARDAVISKKLDGTDAVTIAELAKDKGMKVGIISSVSINHATPAVFYAHEASRNNYYSIGVQLAESDFDFFGGGGFVRPDDYGTAPHVLDIAEANGFTVVSGASALAAVEPGARVIATDPYVDSGMALYYDIDRVDDPETMTLAEYTSECIRLLQDHPGGFFMMVESGKIDWACHANDARASIDDTLAFDDAVGVAIDFMAMYPQETLIVVTGDHECGGLTIGWAGTAYNNFWSVLENQTVSYVGFAPILADYVAATPWSGVEDDIDDTLKDIILDCFGLDYATLTAYEQSKLEAAYDRARNGAPLVSAEEDYLLYGGYNALTVTITHILNQRAGLGWTSYAHTGVPLPVYAAGRGAYLFEGFYDNTDIAKKLATAMAVTLDN